jgi:hypothetical protein
MRGREPAILNLPTKDAEVQISRKGVGRVVISKKILVSRIWVAQNPAVRPFKIADVVNVIERRHPRPGCQRYSVSGMMRNGLDH